MTNIFSDNILHFLININLLFSILYIILISNPFLPIDIYFLYYIYNNKNFIKTYLCLM